MATADRLEREAQRRNPWPYIDKALADQRDAEPINLQPNQDFRGDTLLDNRDLDVADSKRQLNAAAIRADQKQVEAAASGLDMYAYYAEQNSYSPGEHFLEKSALISQRESKLRTARDVMDFDFLAQAIEDARSKGIDVNVEDINNSVDWRKVNLAADKVTRLILDDPDKNKIAIENVYKTLEADNPLLASIVPEVATAKLEELATDPGIVEQGVGWAIQAIDTILTPFIVLNENVMQSARAGLLQSQEAAQGGNGQLGITGAFLGGAITRRSDVEEGDLNEDYIQSIREATDDEGNPLYSQTEVDVAVALVKLKATNPGASPWEVFVDFANDRDAKEILGSMVSGVGPRAFQHAELLRQIDSAHLGNTGQMLFGAGVDEAYNAARGSETRQDLANILGFGASVALDPTIVGTKIYRGVQGARYMLAHLAPVSEGAVGARSLLSRGKGFGPFRLNNKTYRFFDQLAKDLNRYEEALKKADDLPAGAAQTEARVQADALRNRITRQYGQIPDETITDIFATVPRSADGTITVDNIADYIDEANAEYLVSYVTLEEEALRLGYTANEVPRFVAEVLDLQGIKSFDQMISGGGQLKRGDLTPQMTSLGVLRKSVANKIASEAMPMKKSLGILQEFVDTTNAGSIAQSMSDNATEIGRASQKFKRSQGEGFFDSTRRMFSSIAVDNVVDLADPNAAKQVYRYSRAFLPQKMSEVVANAWRNGDTGSRRLLLSAIVRSAATSRGLTVTKAQADAWMGRVEELIDMTGKKPNEAYGQKIKASEVPSRKLAQAQARGVQSQGVGGLDDTRLPGVGSQSLEASIAEPAWADGPILFHGTSQRFANDEVVDVLELDQSRNIVGPGLYSTTGYRTASTGYTRKGSGEDPVTYSVQWIGPTPPRVLDAEEVAPDFVRSFFNNTLRDSDSYLGGNLYDDARIFEVLDDPSSTTLDIIRAARSSLARDVEEPLIRYEVDEYLKDFNLVLQESGFDVLRHTGGKIRSDAIEEHDVFVWLGTDNLRVTQVDDAAAQGLSRPLDAVRPVVDRSPSIKSRSEKQDELLDRLGATEDDIIEGRVSWEEASRVEEQILDEYRAQVLDDPKLLDEFLSTIGFGGTPGTIKASDWWLEPVPGQPMLDGPRMPGDLGAAAGSTKRLRADGTISRQNLSDIIDAYGEEHAMSWLYTGYIDNYLEDNLNIPIAPSRLRDKFGRDIPGWRGLSEEWYASLLTQTGKEYRIAVPWARGGNKGRRAAEQEDLEYQFEVYRDQAIEDVRSSAYDRELDEFILANREIRRDVRWEPVPAREPVFNPAIREPEPLPFRTAKEAEQEISLSADARGVESALHLDQTSRYVRVPNLAEMEELRTDMGPLGKAMYGGHRGLEWYTNMWSIGTLFGWRFSIRNAIEELGLWFLTAGSVSALVKGRLADTARRRQSPDLYFKEIKHGRRKGEIKLVWKQQLGPVNRQIERARRGVAAASGRPKGETLAGWQAEWAEAKGMPGYFMRNVILPVVAPRVNVDEMQKALLQYAQGNTEPWAKLVLEGLVGYQLGGKSLASFGIMGDDDLQVLSHFLYSSHAQGLMDEVLQGGTFLNSARNPSIRSYANGLDGLDELPAGVLLGTVDEELALAALKKLGDKVGVKVDGFSSQAVASRRQIEDWHHLLRAVAQGDGAIGDEAIRGLYDISYGRTTSAQVKANIAQAIRNDETGDYMARFSRLSTQEGIDQFSSDYFEDVLAMFQRQDGSINTRILDRFFDKEGNYLGWGRPRPTLDDGIVYEDRLTAADLAAVPPKERPAALMLPNRSEREYIPFAGTLPGFVDKAYMWMGRQNGRLSRGPVFLANMFTLWKASRNRREQISRALASTRGRNYDELTPEVRDYYNNAAGAIVSKHVFDDAYELSLAFMDNPANRSNLAWKARNISRYYRASEDFYRRMRRMAVSNPEAYAKAAIAYSLVDDTGLVYTDDYGDKYFIYPMNGVAQEITGLALRKIFRMDAAPELFESKPFTIGGKLLGLTPSADTMNLVPPLTSGWGQIPTTLTFSVVPQFAGARALTLGQYNQPTGNLLGDFLNAFLPAGAKRISPVQDPELIAGQIGDSTVKAVQTMTGWGLFDEITIRDGDTVTKVPLSEATDAQIAASEEMRAADVFGTGIFFDKMFSSFFLPAFPQIFGNNVSEFARGMNTDSMTDAYYDYQDLLVYDDEFVALLEDAIGKEIYDPYNYAKTEWWMLKVNRIIDGDEVADGGSFLPYTVGSYEDAPDANAQRANIRATAETLDWFHSDEGYERYPQDLQGAALFLAPREGEWDANGHYVLKNLLGVRVRKDDDDKLREIMDVEVVAKVGRVKFRYDEQRRALDPYDPNYAEELRRINAAEKQERKDIKAEFPRSRFATFEIDRGTALEAAEDMRRLIAWERENSPDGKLGGTDVGWFATALRIYDKAELQLAQYPRETNRDRAERNRITAERDAEYRSLMEINDKVKNFIESVVIPMGE